MALEGDLKKEDDEEEWGGGYFQSMGWRVGRGGSAGEVETKTVA